MHAEPEFWQQLCPKLHITTSEMREVAKRRLGKRKKAELRKRMHEDGYFTLTAEEEPYLLSVS